MPELVLVCANDWEGLYIDGRLYAENHSIDRHVIMDRVGGRVLYLTPLQDKALCDRGALPEALDGLKDLA